MIAHAPLVRVTAGTYTGMTGRLLMADHETAHIYLTAWGLVVEVPVADIVVEQPTPRLEEAQHA